MDPVSAPSATWLYERRSQKLNQLYVSRPELKEAPLVPMRPVEIRARDGLTMVSYLTLPKVADPMGTGMPTKPAPMVLLVHGGPWDRDGYGYDAHHQWLANRGYAVLSVNFRGSTGFGKNFVASIEFRVGGFGAVWGARAGSRAGAARRSEPLTPIARPATLA
jgi:dipeptidyl aminopeptidase/acylaminoacyl peptidase